MLIEFNRQKYIVFDMFIKQQKGNLRDNLL